jgi:hypothetical protein
MLSYANPDQKNNLELKKDTARQNRGDGYGLVYFNKSTNMIVFECWPRFANLAKGDSEQFSGWPIRYNNNDNDGREPLGYLKEIDLPFDSTVVELTNDKTGELVYCYRVMGKSFKAPVFSEDKHTLKVGENIADKILIQSSRLTK